MNTKLTEEEMRRALFGGPVPIEQVTASEVQHPSSKRISAHSLSAQHKKNAAKPFKPRLKVTLRVSNEFEGKAYEMIHEADTISTLLAEQAAVKVARKNIGMWKLFRLSQRKADPPLDMLWNVRSTSGRKSYVTQNCVRCRAEGDAR